MRSYLIKKMTLRELAVALDWAAAEGWNPGLHDADCFYAADPDGFLIGLVGDEPAATLSAVKYGVSYGFIGLYIVKPPYRGQGFGAALFAAGIDRLDGRTVGLDGVVERQDVHKKYGFKLAYKNIRYRGTGGGQAPTDPGIIPLSALPFGNVAAYDRSFFPERRTVFLRCWLDQPGAAALGIRQNGRLAGYGVLRKCRMGYKAGPLFADTPELADRLFTVLKNNTEPGASVLLDAPEANPAAGDLAIRHGMNVVFETARMYRGKHPDEPLDRVYGITTYELG